MYDPISEPETGILDKLAPIIGAITAAIVVALNIGLLYVLWRVLF